MAWITPKTDWVAETNSAGIYTGDYFNVEDYNRIKNNMVIVYAMAGLGTIDLGDDKVCTESEISHIYASEFNALEDALDEIIATHDLGIDERPFIYVQNGKAVTADELNRIEGAQLAYYEYYS